MGFFVWREYGIFPKKDMHASFAKMRGNLMNSVVVLVTKNLAKTRNAWQNKPE